MSESCEFTPFFALRFGDLYHEGWRLTQNILKKAGPKVEITAADLEPSIRQKGVDMRIGLDIANLTIKRQVNVILLVTGDSDLVPAMKFARPDLERNQRPACAKYAAQCLIRDFEHLRLTSAHRFEPAILQLCSPVRVSGRNTLGGTCVVGALGG